MAKKYYNMKWREQDISRLNNLVRRANAKRRRLFKQNDAYRYVFPDSFNRRDIRQNIVSRADFNREMNVLERFLKADKKQLTIKRGARGALYTDWQVKEIRYRQNIINRRRAEERKRYGFYEPGEKPEWHIPNYQEMRTMPFEFDIDTLTQEGFEYKQRYGEQESTNYINDIRGAQYKQSYLRAINTVLGDAGNEIVRRVRAIDNRKFYDMSNMNEVFTTGYVYNTPIAPEVMRDIILEELDKEGV